MEQLRLSESQSELERAVKGFFLINQHLFVLQEKLTPIKAEWQGRIDARRQALNALATPCIGGTLMVFNMLYQLGKDSTLKEFAALADIKQEPDLKIGAYNHLMMFTLASGILLFQFQVENLFQNLWIALGKNYDRQYWRLVGNLLTELDLKTSDRLNNLRFLKEIRNSLHNNGIHGGDDWSFQVDVRMETALGPIQLDGLQEFKKYKIVECSPMAALAAFCSAIMVIEDVLTAPRISSIIGPIPDIQSLAS